MKQFLVVFPMNQDAYPYVPLFQSFVADPSLENFLRLRSAIIADRRYHPYRLEDFERLEEQFQLGFHGVVLNNIDELRPNFLLTPSLHFLHANAAEDAGEKTLAELEEFICERCYDGILATGDGSFEAPYLVTRVMEEDDILLLFGKERCDARLIAVNGRHYDCVFCNDGSEIWFDVTDSMKFLLRSVASK